MTATVSKFYSNQALTSEQIIGMLRKRGLSVANEKKSIVFLKDVSYFRLAAYLRPLEADKTTHKYKPTATLEKAIARSYSIPQHEILESWIKNLNAIRNACAHHSRLWNCIMAQTPILPSRMKSVWISNTNVDTFRLYASMCSLIYWLNAINPDNTFVHEFKALLIKYPNVDTAAMGFPENWQDEMLWA